MILSMIIEDNYLYNLPYIRPFPAENLIRKKICHHRHRWQDNYKLIPSIIKQKWIAKILFIEKNIKLVINVW